jgi:hypothetical protein
MIPYKAYYISPFILEQGRALQHATNDVFLKGVMEERSQYNQYTRGQDNHNFCS